MLFFLATADIRFPESGGRVGISNLGNTCFMNSMLQCLGQTGEMASIFLHMKNPYASQDLVKGEQFIMTHTQVPVHSINAPEYTQ